VGRDVAGRLLNEGEISTGKRNLKREVDLGARGPKGGRRKGGPGKNSGGEKRGDMGVGGKTVNAGSQ